MSFSCASTVSKRVLGGGGGGGGGAETGDE